jgi:hypothetical protein
MLVPPLADVVEIGLKDYVLEDGVLLLHLRRSVAAHRHLFLIREGVVDGLDDLGLLPPDGERGKDPRQQYHRNYRST